jgi:hypothetical protein
VGAANRETPPGSPPPLTEQAFGKTPTIEGKYEHHAQESTQTAARGFSLDQELAELRRRQLPGGQIGIRNSRDTGGPVLAFTPDEWRAFLGGVRNGEFDLPVN